MGIRDFFRRALPYYPPPVALALAAQPPSPAVVREIVFMGDREPPRRVYRDLPLFGVDNWDNVNMVRDALVQLDKGMFDRAALLIDAMMADDRIAGVWSCRADGLLGLPIDMRVPKNHETDERAIKLAEAAETAWEEMAPEQALGELLKWGRFLGFGLAEKIYPPGKWTPVLKVWHPKFVFWDWGTRVYRLITAEGVVDLDPSDPATRRKWIFYCPWGYARGWVQGRVRSLAIPWLIRQWAYRDWARHNEVHGIPVRKVKVPAQWDDQEKQRALQEIAQLATESVIRCPVDSEGNGFDLELVEPQSNSYEAFEHLIAKADTAIAVVLLGQNLTTEIGDKGSRAAAQVHDRVRQDVIRSDAESLSTCLHDQLMLEWCAYNQKDDPVLAPWPGWDIVPPQDEMKAGTALRALAESMLVFRQSQLPFDYGELAENYGLPLEPGKEISEFQDPQVAAAKEKAKAMEAMPAPGGKEGDVPAKKKMALGHISAPLLRGQAYTDALAEEIRAVAQPLFSPFLRKLLATIEGAQSYDEIRSRVLAIYRDHKSPRELADLIEKAVILSELNGILSVREEP